MKQLTQDEQNAMFKAMCQAFRCMSLHAADSTMHGNKVVVDCTMHGNEVVVDNSDVRIKEWRKLLAVKQFTQSVVDFETVYKKWRMSLHNVMCSCGREVAVPRNLRCDLCMDESKLRSDAAKRAVKTKRRKYTKWPTRRKDHVALNYPR